MSTVAAMSVVILLLLRIFGLGSSWEVMSMMYPFLNGEHTESPILTVPNFVLVAFRRACCDLALRGPFPCDNDRTPDGDTRNQAEIQSLKNSAREVPSTRKFLSNSTSAEITRAVNTHPDHELTTLHLETES